MKRLLLFPIIACAAAIAMTSGANAKDTCAHKQCETTYTSTIDTTIYATREDAIYLLSADAWHSYVNDDVDSAIVKYRDIVVTYCDATAFENCVVLMSNEGDSAGIISLYDWYKAHTTNNFGPRGKIEVCPLLVDCGRYDEALDMVFDMVRGYETVSDGVRLLVGCNFPKEYKLKVINDFNNSIDIIKRDEYNDSTAEFDLLPVPYMYELIGCIYHNIDDIASAIDAFEKARESEIEDWGDEAPRLYYDMRIIGSYAMSQDYDNMLRVGARALEADPLDADMLREVAYVYRDLGQFDKAIDMLSHYPDSLAGYDDILYCQGVVYTYAGDNEAALDALSRYNSAYFLNNEEYDLHAVRLQADALLRTGRADEARKLVLATGFDQIEDSTLITADYPKMYLLAGDIENACRMMDYVLEVYDTDETRHYAAQLYTRLGDYDKAIEYLGQAYDKGWFFVMQDWNDPELAPLRNDQRFIRILSDRADQLNPTIKQYMK